MERPEGKEKPPTWDDVKVAVVDQLGRPRTDDRDRAIVARVAATIPQELTAPGVITLIGPAAGPHVVVVPVRPERTRDPGYFFVVFSDGGRFGLARVVEFDPAGNHFIPVCLPDHTDPL